LLGNVDSLEDTSLTWESGIKKIFSSKCTSCHGASSTFGNWSDYTAVKTSMLSTNNKKNILFRVKEKTMPLGGAPLDNDTIALLEAWKAAGMPEVAAGPTPPSSDPIPTEPPTDDPVPSDPPPSDLPPSDPPPSDPPADEFDVVAVVKNQCLSCHSNTTGLYPFLEGQSKGYLKKELLHFKSRKRLDEVSWYMNEVVQQFSDSELKKIAYYLAKQDRCKNKVVVDPLQGDVANGKELFANSCVGCHSKGKRSFSTPFVHGLGTQYLKNTMAHFVAVANPRPASLMASMIAPLSTKQVEDIAAYLNSETICEE